MAHARRKFFDLHVANKSQLAEQALHSIGGLYEVERHAKEMSDEDRGDYARTQRCPSLKNCMSGCWLNVNLCPRARPQPRFCFTA